MRLQIKYQKDQMKVSEIFSLKFAISIRLEKYAANFNNKIFDFQMFYHGKEIFFLFGKCNKSDLTILEIIYCVCSYLLKIDLCRFGVKFAIVDIIKIRDAIQKNINRHQFY